MRRLLTMLITTFAIVGCGTAQPPLDSQNRTPEQVMIATYTSILEDHYDEAIRNFSHEFITEFVTSKEISFEEYCQMTAGWQVEWLNTVLVGNDYNDDVWRVKIIPDEGKGKHNGPGVVQDLHIIDGEWKIVFWGHYPRS